MRHLHDVFAASRKAFASRTAVEVRGRRFSYAETGAIADALAAALVNRGRPRRVGVVGTRTPGAYLGYLAALRTGATVVPLNPAFPPARVAAICEAARVEVVLADDAAADLAGSAPVLRVDVDELAGAPAEPLPPAASGEDVAYVLYTSGSTGAPKGVPITHRNVLSYLAEVSGRYEVGPESRLTQAFDLTFDPSVYDMFVAWGTGATLVVPSRDELLRPVDFVVRQRITHWFSVPSVVSYARRLRQLAPDAMPDLRWSLFAGEQLTLDDAAAWQRSAPGSRIANLYGPTELTVTCTAYRLPAEPGDWPRTANGTVPIGQVHPGHEHLIVDPDGHPAATGELVMRGPQRFPGYADSRDDAGRFVTVADGRAVPYDGSSRLTGEHWYRTGDQVTEVDGALVHLGRIDQQVKVRGYRVELGEIEAVLRAQPGIDQAVVVALPTGHGEVDLHAAYTGERHEPQMLSRTIGAALPAYMVPRDLTAVETLPLNSNGKIDRKAVAGLLSSGRSR